MGALGVALIAGTSGPDLDAQMGVSVIACLIGASCYGLAGIYIRKFAASVKPAAMAACSQIMAAAILSPVLTHLPPLHVVTPLVVGSLLTLALICSGAAYLLYFRLLADAGPSRALTVTFLMPVFGMLWGALFLHETVTPQMMGGCALIVGGTACVLGIISTKRLKEKQA
jgi:drug/metabolite transporter (DMT)-like permease